MNTFEIYETFGKYFFDVATPEQVHEMRYEMVQHEMAISRQEEIQSCKDSFFPV